MNIKFAALVVLGTCSLIAAAPEARAADHGIYLGAGISQSNTDLGLEGFGSGDTNDNGFKLIAGWRPLDWLAVEANYIDIGGFADADTSLDSKAITVSGLVLAEIGIVDLYARLGMANWDTRFAADGDSASDSGWDPTYGVGVGLHFGSLGVRAEYERFSASPFDESVDVDASTISLSVMWTFL